MKRKGYKMYGEIKVTEDEIKEDEEWINPRLRQERILEINESVSKTKVNSVTKRVFGQENVYSRIRDHTLEDSSLRQGD